jgi:hypothetical protein
VAAAKTKTELHASRRNRALLQNNRHHVLIFMVQEPTSLAASQQMQSPDQQPVASKPWCARLTSLGPAQQRFQAQAWCLTTTSRCRPARLRLHLCVVPLLYSALQA